MSDLIDRAAAIDALYDWSEHSMTDAEAWHIRQVIGDIKSLPPAEPNCSEIPNNSDCISRQAAIDAIKAASKEIQHWLWEAEGCEGYCAMVADVETCLDDLPSAQPERKTGKWSVEFSPAYKGGAYCECSQCNYKFAMGAYFEPDEWNFCPNCGADMRGEQDGSD